MAHLKERKEASEIVEKIGFNKIEDYMAIEGLKGSMFEGREVVVHQRLGKKLIARKLAKQTKSEIELDENPNRTTQKIKK